MAVWSTIDAEYGSFNWLRRECAIKLGQNPDARLLNRPERANIDSIIESAVMEFATANAPSVPKVEEDQTGEGRDGQQIESNKESKRRAPHRWSFLRKVHDLVTTVGTDTYELPSDFAYCIGEPTTNRKGGRISIVSESHLRQLISSSPSSGKPAYAATRQKSLGGTTKESTDLILYPSPDANETIQIEYSVVPATLTKDNPYPPGGKEHAQTILAYCYYVIAQRSGKELEQATLYVRDRLAASVVMDNASSKPTADGVWVDDDGRFTAAYLSRQIGRHIGAGPNPDAWSHQQTQLIAEIIRNTLRRVYNPPLVFDEKYPHGWSFLRPLATLQTVADENTYDLPADFATLHGPLTYMEAGSTFYREIMYVGEAQLRQLSQTEFTSSRPTKAAIVPKAHDTAAGTRWQLLLWPTPDTAYQIGYRYKFNPDTINLLPIDENEFTLHGGDRYAEMFLEAAFLTADERQGVKRSVHEARFMRAVHAAVGADRLQHTPDNMGYNWDRSDRDNRQYDSHDYSEHIVTYNGRTS